MNIDRPDEGISIKRQFKGESKKYLFGSFCILLLHIWRSHKHFLQRQTHRHQCIYRRLYILWKTKKHDRKCRISEKYWIVIIRWEKRTIFDFVDFEVLTRVILTRPFLKTSVCVTLKLQILVPGEKSSLKTAPWENVRNTILNCFHTLDSEIFLKYWILSTEYYNFWSY